jgi:hypothetical protein
MHSSPRQGWPGSRSLADAIITAEGDDAALRLLPFGGFAQSNTVVTMSAQPLHPLLRLYGTQGPRWRLAARCPAQRHLRAACARARNRQVAGTARADRAGRSRSPPVAGANARHRGSRAAGSACRALLS